MYNNYIVLINNYMKKSEKPKLFDTFIKNKKI